LQAEEAFFSIRAGGWAGKSLCPAQGISGLAFSWTGHRELALPRKRPARLSFANTPACSPFRAPPSAPAASATFGMRVADQARGFFLHPFNCEFPLHFPQCAFFVGGDALFPASGVCNCSAFAPTRASRALGFFAGPKQFRPSLGGTWTGKIFSLSQPSALTGLAPAMGPLRPPSACNARAPHVGPPPALSPGQGPRSFPGRSASGWSGIGHERAWSWGPGRAAQPP